MSGTLRAYSHPGLTKADFLAELAEHAAQDRIAQGTYWDGSKGCAVGCSLHSVSSRLGFEWANKCDFGHHASYEKYLGIPEVLVRLEDCLFEGLPLAEARKWPLRFAEAIPAGADLSGVWDSFAPWLLREIALPAAGSNKAVRRAIIGVAEGYETQWFSQTAASARDAALAVARANAAYAAETAFAATNAADAVAYVTRYAASAAHAASQAAVYAAEAGDAPARRGAYLRMADKLRVLLAASPVPAL